MKTGQCLCGAVKYEFAGEPAFVGGCYCKECQRGSGGGHIVIAGVPETALKVIGKTNSYVRAGGSGKNITRVFCPTCGSPLYSRPESVPGMLMVRLGTLDDSSGYQPMMNIFCSEAAVWDAPPAQVPAHARMPG